LRDPSSEIAYQGILFADFNWDQD